MTGGDPGVPWPRPGVGRALGMPTPGRGHATQRWVKAACAVWAVVLIAVSGRLVLSAGSQGVYPIFADAARHWLNGQPVYNTGGEPYRYSPLVTILLVPFSLLPDGIAGILWRWFNAGVFLTSLGWWCRAVLPPDLTVRRAAVFFLLVVPVSVGSLNNGQSNPLVLGLLLAAGAAVASQRWNLGAACLALASLFKLYPIAIALLLVAGYPRRLGGRLALALTLGVALPFLLTAPEYVTAQYAGWLHHLANDDRQAWPLLRGYRDMRMLFRLWLTPLSGHSYLAIQLVAAAGVAALCQLQRPGAGSPRPFLRCALGLGCCWMTVLGPATESTTYMFVAPASAWALIEAWSARMGLLRPATLLASYALFLASQVALWFPWGGRFNNLGTHPLAGLLLLGSLVTSAFRQAGQDGKAAWSEAPERLVPGSLPFYDRAA